MKRLFLILLILSFYITNTFSQVKLYGEQIRGADKNAELVCESVLISSEMKIVKVEGDNNGFWIENQNGVLQSFYLDDSGTYFPEAIGFVLKPGKYSVYPNLSSGKSKATVKLYLE